jgi:hypothetical protein
MTHPKRRSPRYHSYVPVKIIIGKQAIETVAVSISEHGLFLLTDLAVDPNSLMQLVVQLPDGAHRMVVVARFVGQASDGRGIGAEIFAASNELRRSWSALNGSLAREARAAGLLQAVG